VFGQLILLALSSGLTTEVVEKSCGPVGLWATFGHSLIRACPFSTLISYPPNPNTRPWSCSTVRPSPHRSAAGR